MKVMKIIYVWFQLCGFLFANKADVITNDDLISIIKDAKNINFSEMPREGDLSMVSATLVSGGADESWALLQLFKWKKYDRIYLNWWESESSVNRVLSLLCMMVKMDEERLDAFKKHKMNLAFRYKEAESLQRQNEIEKSTVFLKDKKLRELLLSILEKK